MSETQTKKASIWNVPNALTVFRVFLIIPFVIFLLGGDAGLFGSNQLIPCVIADLIFVVASLTDLADGKIARKYHLVTNFGKFMDPLADKLLVCSAMICLVEMKRIPAWVVIVIIAREFIISGFRLIAADNGIVIAASWWGKFKTTSQMILCIILILPGLPNLLGSMIINIFTALVLVLTIVSLVDYMSKNIKVITDGGM